MFNYSEKLKTLGYMPLEKDVHYEDDLSDKLSTTIKYTVPKSYLQFLRSYPQTGVFEVGVLCKGIESAPCAPSGLYPISVLYATCVNLPYDLLQLNSIKCEMPDYLLVIGEDDGGNYFCIDLRQDKNGAVYFLDHELDIDEGLYLLSTDFESFIANLVADID
jgi:hypothetical protein